MSALATIRTAVRALLDDADASRYSNDQIDQSLRMALQEYAAWRPRLLTYNLDGADSRYLTLPADFEAVRIVRAELHSDTGLTPLALTFHAEFCGGQWTLETLNRIVRADESLDLYYLAPGQAIQDLDGAQVTTLPAQDEPCLQLGAAGYTLLSRAASQGEANTIQDEATKHLSALARQYMQDFRGMLATGQVSAVYGSLPPC